MSASANTSWGMEVSRAVIQASAPFCKGGSSPNYSLDLCVTMVCTSMVSLSYRFREGQVPSFCVCVPVALACLFVVGRVSLFFRILCRVFFTFFCRFSIAWRRCGSCELVELIRFVSRFLLLALTVG